MTAPSPVPLEALHRPCTLRGLEFETTADLAGLPDTPGILGQARAREAVELAVGLRTPGYNLYVLGAHGQGRTTLVREVLAARACPRMPGVSGRPARSAVVSNSRPRSCLLYTSDAAD